MSWEESESEDEDIGSLREQLFEWRGGYCETLRQLQYLYEFPTTDSWVITEGFYRYRALLLDLTETNITYSSNPEEFLSIKRQAISSMIYETEEKIYKLTRKLERAYGIEQ